MTDKTPKSEEEWRAILSPEAFAVLRKKGTERPFVGKYTDNFQEGTYNCAGCNAPLYKSTTKFKTHCGWPSFYEAIPGAIKRISDNSLGMSRTEIVCSNCDGHLGHVFKGEGYKVPTDERHCVNKGDQFPGRSWDYQCFDLQSQGSAPANYTI
ncbi:Peptide methionine sulfoxide reductase B5 [Zancudomyces culisetae]|uniref:Peptide-methionine (R)-S-oxide reductase n=1 Tax=Zancudomyces culisetae TaxID=1213189 RepID=A0A1R1PXS4_ZANCU|nr:Peptide methionine sulfoxide reductase B5 [Zancudomyces culisetae]|eukprot:OMH85722.1 Peptide methionine sulfoxide reductase B5 [Zancudomyces culisetae]